MPALGTKGTGCAIGLANGAKIGPRLDPEPDQDHPKLDADLILAQFRSGPIPSPNSAQT